ncbi:MAG: MBL fold metallo-hydrolase [Nitrososphaeraceae archaeon]|jgi:glyoxylase-like metal-dependent hydrolase (beta-lactamase superfamily II)
MTTIASNFQKNRLGVFLIVATASSLLLVTYLINPIGQISQQQYAFAQKNTGVLEDNKTSDNNTTFPQIHNYASAPPAPVNSWIIESKNGVVVIDTQRQFSEAKNVLKEVENIHKRILGVIFTHPHPDHVNGAAALLNGTANVPIYATQSTFNVLKNDTGGYIALSKQLLPHNEYSKQVVLPNRIVSSGENIIIDGITYHFDDLGIGEADDMMVIYLPLQKLIFTGDIINNHMHPFFAGAISPESRSHISEWIKQIEYLQQKYPDVKILFPGHGPSGVAKALLDEQLNYLNTFRSLVRQQMQLAPTVGRERAVANITEQGKSLIKGELQKLYPGYEPVATLPNMLDYNIDALAKEISQEK